MPRLQQLCQAFGRENIFVEVQRHYLRGEERRNLFPEAVAGSTRACLSWPPMAHSTTIPSGAGAGCLYLHAASHLPLQGRPPARGQ